jgi:NhaA family Na+:H+ antiporter
VERFLKGPAAGGLALLAASGAALAWANLSGSYEAALAWQAGGMSLQAWVNDGLMALFFLSVGLEIRWELTEGALATPRLAAAPGVAALGGMAVPALVYAAFNWRDPAALLGWAVPVATDIAFALAALSVLGSRVPPALRAFMAALAIIDDLLAIIVIAVFYATGLSVPALLAAAGVLAALAGLRACGTAALPPYLLAGVALWAAILFSGIHPTLAGVLVAFAVPGGETAHALQRRLHPWVTWLVLPLFGLANAGVRFQGADLAGPVGVGIMLGLVAGKPVGVFLAVRAAERLGLVHLAGISWREMFGAAALCGIGFTMSLFIGDLAFHGSAEHARAKLAVFAASVVAAAVGLLILRLALPRGQARSN